MFSVLEDVISAAVVLVDAGVNKMFLPLRLGKLLVRLGKLILIPLEKIGVWGGVIVVVIGWFVASQR